MKLILKIIVFGLFLLQYSCTKDDSTIENLKTQLIGQWQLTSRIADAGNGPYWFDVIDGYTYAFNRDGSFTSTRFDECTYGTYSLTETELRLIFGCPDFNVWFESSDGAFVYSYVINDNTIDLTPILPMCIEQCMSRFEKITETP